MRLPVINERVTIYVPQGIWKGRYPTYLEAVDEQTLRVAHPMYRSALLPVMPGDEVVVEYLEGGERVGFEATVLERSSGDMPTLVLTRPEPGAIRRLQLRNFVRLDVSLPVDYAPSGTRRPASEGEGEAELKSGRVVNLSGGGAQLLVEEEFPVGARLDLVLHLPDRVIPAEAEVVRHITEPHAPPRLGVRFTAIEERDRERIVRYIFAEQRQRRRKGLL
ncbi:MAG: PilZ domain-containing protein [Symbiobacterium sp.]|uniref:flagellar brake protein n=1 Tax=Symbiobacterium sp. TaxID=1971213 RepID=UPI003463DA4B